MLYSVVVDSLYIMKHRTEPQAFSFLGFHQEAHLSSIGENTSRMDWIRRTWPSLFETS